MIEYTEEHIFIEVSRIISIPREYFEEKDWDNLNEMNKDEIIDLMDLNSIDMNSEVVENLNYNLNQD